MEQAADNIRIEVVEEIRELNSHNCARSAAFAEGYNSKECRGRQSTSVRRNMEAIGEGRDNEKLCVMPPAVQRVKKRRGDPKGRIIRKRRWKG